MTAAGAWQTRGLAPARLGEGQRTPRGDVLVSVTLSGCSLPQGCKVSQSRGADPFTCKPESQPLSKPKVPQRACVGMHRDNAVQGRVDHFLSARETNPAWASGARAAGREEGTTYQIPAQAPMTCHLRY